MNLGYFYRMRKAVKEWFLEAVFLEGNGIPCFSMLKIIAFIKEEIKKSSSTIMILSFYKDEIIFFVFQLWNRLLTIEKKNKINHDKIKSNWIKKK